MLTVPATNMCRTLSKVFVQVFCSPPNQLSKHFPSIQVGDDSGSLLVWATGRGCVQNFTLYALIFPSLIFVRTGSPVSRLCSGYWKT